MRERMKRREKKFFLNKKLKGDLIIKLIYNIFYFLKKEDIV